MFGRRKAEPSPGPRLDREMAEKLMAVQRPEVFPGVASARPVSLFDQLACQHCGGVHARNCPAVEEIEYTDDGKVRRVRFWPHGTWPADEVLWRADVQEALQDDGEGV